MQNELRGSLKGVLNYIPILLLLGILTGFGAHTTLFGAFAISFCFLIFKRNLSFLFGASIVYAITVAGANVSLGGRSETLYAVLFLSSLITIAFSFLNVYKKTILTIPKAVSSGIMSGCALGVWVLSLPLILGHKTFTSIFLMFNSTGNFFSNINESSLIIFAVILGSFYYFSKIKSLPAYFLSWLTGIIVSIIYKMDLNSIYLGLENFKIPVNADFANMAHILLFALVISIVCISQILSSARKLKPKKIILLTGISGAISSIGGAISGGIVPCKNKSRYMVLAEFILLLIFVIFYNKISSFIPMVSVASVAFIKCLGLIKHYIQSQKNKNIQSKIIFCVCFLSSFYNIIFGVILAIILTLITKTPKKEFNEQKN